jgi:c-di-GMP-binding flagellar brake protein YcgR
MSGCPTPAALDRVRLRLEGEDGWLRARIRRRAGRRLELLLPAGIGGPDAGRSVQILLGAPDAAYLYRARIVKYHEAAGDQRRVALLLDPSTPERWQRREFFRMRVGFPFAVELPLDEDAPVQAESPGTLHLFRLLDLSGGGCLCLDPAERLRPGRLYRARLKLPELPEYLLLTARVARRTRLSGTAAAGLEFAGVRERQRQQILCALFSEYRSRRTAWEDLQASSAARLASGRKPLEPGRPVL